jgi:predicted RNase H-like HicB family nuclease
LYIAIIDQASDGTYGVSFPDLPGCVSAGDNLPEALKNARDALGLHLHGLEEEGLTVPAPRPLATILDDPEHRAGAVAFTPVEPRLPRGRAVRINVSIDEHLLAEIDRAAETEGLSRSAYLSAAASARLGSSRQRQRKPGRAIA